MLDYRKLNELIAKSEMSKRKIAELCNISHVTLYNALNGESLTVKTLEKLSNVLGVSPASLFVEDDAPQPTAHIEVKGRNTLHQSANIYADGSAHLLDKIKMLEQTIKDKEQTIKAHEQSLRDKDKIIELLTAK